MKNHDEAVAEAPVSATNMSISERLGCNHSTVSRIRSGHRYPSRQLMRRIEEVYGWRLIHQMELLPDTGRNMRYALAFEKNVVARKEISNA